MKKNLLFALLCIFVFSSCGDDTLIDTADGLTLIEKSGFNVSVPSSWVVMEDIEKLLPQPSEGAIELAVTAKDLKGGFSNNFLILSDQLNRFATSKEYSMLNNVGATESYLEYLELDRRDMVFQDDEETILYEFEARYNLETPKLRFLQAARVCNQKEAYLFTIALSSDITETSKYEAFLSTFTCK